MVNQLAIPAKFFNASANSQSKIGIYYVTTTQQTAIANGRDPSKTTTPIWSEHVVEIQPLDSINYDIAWEWRAWEHIIQDFEGSLPFAMAVAAEIFSQMMASKFPFGNIFIS